MRRASATDELFIDAPPGAVYRAITDVASGWWTGARITNVDNRITVRAPGFRRRSSPVRFEARMDGFRHEEGFTWWLDGGELKGRGEWWFEPFKAGTIVHYFTDVEPGDRGRLRRWSSRVRRHRWAVRKGLNALKDHLEGRVRAPSRG